MLVDRVWPRGMTKEALAIDAWLKEIAPSNELRKWFRHDPQKWEHKQRYFHQLDTNPEGLRELIETAAHRRIEPSSRSE